MPTFPDLVYKIAMTTPNATFATALGLANTQIATIQADTVGAAIIDVVFYQLADDTYTYMIKYTGAAS